MTTTLMLRCFWTEAARREALVMVDANRLE